MELGALVWLMPVQELSNLYPYSPEALAMVCWLFDTVDTCLPLSWAVVRCPLGVHIEGTHATTHDRQQQECSGTAAKG